MDEVALTPRPVDLLAPVIGPERMERFSAALDATRERLGGSTVWHVNSTAAGGGVAEMLQSVLAYPAAEGIEVRWLVVEGDEPFFEVTKRIHHLLHGRPGDGGPLGEHEREVYERTLAGEREAAVARVRPGDAVVLHDPQVLGLAPALAAHGARVLWCCHIGADEADAETRRAWDFLTPYTDSTAVQTFSRPQYRWETLDPSRVAVLPPCIDALATKNLQLEEAKVSAILRTLADRADLIQDEPIDPAAPIVCQVSRWDPLKDHDGLMHAFVSRVDAGAQLVLAGPAPGAVEDDPESGEVFNALIAARQALPSPRRRSVHICPLPMEDVEENAAMVNALQRRSDVIVQKSLAEGFGLTVAEAMWKRRPVVGSRVGGIQDQITDGETGLLVDPADPRSVGDAVTWMLTHPGPARRMAEAGHERVMDHYLAPSYLTRQFELISPGNGGAR